jgi:hypothetical protein
MDISVYCDSSDKCQFIGNKGGTDGSSALIGAEMFNSQTGTLEAAFWCRAVLVQSWRSALSVSAVHPEHERTGRMVRAGIVVDECLPKRQS